MWVKASDVAVALQAAVDAEREACAKACEDETVEDTGHDGDVGYNNAVRHCAAAIRARSENA